MPFNAQHRRLTDELQRVFRDTTFWGTNSAEPVRQAALKLAGELKLASRPEFNGALVEPKTDDGQDTIVMSVPGLHGGPLEQIDPPLSYPVLPILIHGDAAFAGRGRWACLYLRHLQV